MGFRRRFASGLIARLFILLLMAFLFVQSLHVERLGAARLVAALLFVGATLSLWRYIQRTNVELARFIEAIRFGDLSHGFAHQHRGSGFEELAEALDHSIRRLRDERHLLSDANRFYEAVLDDAPTALLTVDAEGRVELTNKASRRLFIRHKGVRVGDFREYGNTFVKALGGDVIGRPRLVPLMTEGVPQTAMVSGAVVHRLGGLVRVIAVQPIQGELNAIEIAAQSDLIRVLTHEIMNSMTPVTSLAHSAADLMAKADGGGEGDIADARAAVNTLARRADGVMHFVESYRQISRAPVVRRRKYDALPWGRELEAIFRASDAAEGVRFSLDVEPQSLTLDADPDLMSQVLINLLRNGADAAKSAAGVPEVSLRFRRTRSGRARIEVSDNGPGVPDNLRQDIFLPFFTTKSKGTGVGLSLARQVVLAHQGSIDVAESPAGGAQFRILI
jgi:two-component system, NtrC family, nitrogen regulation sensor histidine kinase NtrY